MFRFVLLVIKKMSQIKNFNNFNLFIEKQKQGLSAIKVFEMCKEYQISLNAECINLLKKTDWEYNRLCE